MRKNGRGYYERPALDESVVPLGIIFVVVLLGCLIYWLVTQLP